MYGLIVAREEEVGDIGTEDIHFSIVFPVLGVIRYADI